MGWLESRPATLYRSSQAVERSLSCQFHPVLFVQDSEGVSSARHQTMYDIPVWSLGRNITGIVRDDTVSKIWKLSHVLNFVFSEKAHPSNTLIPQSPRLPSPIPGLVRAYLFLLRADKEMRHLCALRPIVVYGSMASSFMNPLHVLLPPHNLSPYSEQVLARPPPWYAVVGSFHIPGTA